VGRQLPVELAAKIGYLWLVSYAASLMDVIATYESERRTIIDRAVALGLDRHKPREALLRAWIDLRPMEEPVVVNRHHFAAAALPALCVDVGRREPLCNPFPHGITVSAFRAAAQERGWPQTQIYLHAKRYCAREIDVLALHRIDLWLQLKRGGPVSEALAAVKASAALVCSCATSPLEAWSKPCHAFTLVRAWRWLQTTSSCTGALIERG